MIDLKPRVSSLVGTALSILFTVNVPVSAEMAPVTVPIQIVGTSPIITVRVNGLAIPVHFDIGRSGNLALFPSVLDQIDKVPAGESAGGMSMEGPTGKTPIYRVALVEVGKVKFTNVAIGEDFHDADFQADFVEQKGAHGFAGTGLFEGHRIVIDYRHRELTLISPEVPAGSPSPCYGKSVPLVSGLDWGLVSEPKTDVGEFFFVWDTGAPANVIFKGRTDADKSDIENNATVTFNQFILGEHEFGPIDFEVWEFPNPPPFDGFIGYDFFVNNIVCVDFPGDRLLIRQ